MSYDRPIYPFVAIVDQEMMKKALILNAINPKIGGVLIRGEKGTGKSTIARALTDLLEEIEVVADCPFNCNPHNIEEMCQSCQKRYESREKLPVRKRKMPLVTLPINATEDRVVGTLNIEKALKEGIKALEPAILAEANRGILYIDEVNLLEDHISDLLLDAAAMGVNIVEREGISVSHPSKFLLIGTMNPEEGELRPQIIDRFGLSVKVEGIKDVKQRMEVAKLREEFDAGPWAFKKCFESAQKELVQKIKKAKSLLPSITISEDLLRQISWVCIALGTEGHRADIITVKTAKTIAAFNGRTEVKESDVKEALELVLGHRMRKKPFEEPEISKEALEEAFNKAKEQQPPKTQRNPNNPPPNQSENDSENPDHEKKKEEEEEETKKEGKGEEKPNRGKEKYDEKSEQKHPADGFTDIDKVFEIGPPIGDAQKILGWRKDRSLRPCNGRRLKSISTFSRGKYVRPRIPTGKVKDIAVDATLRAAVTHSFKKGKIDIHSSDLREKVREGRAASLIMFVVDASGSMGVNNRMIAVKGAIFSLLNDTYRRRDKVAMIMFKGNKAEVILPPTKSVELALKRLKELPTGGKTPLPAGIVKGIELIKTELLKGYRVIPMMVLITDGKGNVALFNDVLKDLDKCALQLKKDLIRTIIIDTEDKRFYGLNLIKEFAEKSAAKYYHVDSLEPEKLTSIVSFERSLLDDIFSLNQP